jgi:signal transduction histidine kinase
VVCAGALVAWARTEAIAAVAVLGVAGALLAIWSSVAIGFLVVAGIAAGTTRALRLAAPLALLGPVTLLIATAVHGWSTPLVAGGAAAALGGLVGGIGRRQAQERMREHARVDLARELHDVLAHTLGALAVQLEAATAVEESGDREQLAELLQRSRKLVARGLDETAEAVRALRDEPVPIAERVVALVEGTGVALQIDGAPRPLPAKPGLALYRAAQEAITNAGKHAPGAAVELRLAFHDGETVLTVRNDAAQPSVAPGAGLGLQGMRERVELAGGHVETARTAQGFVVEAAVPA